jgi:hypothetical protein
MHMKTTSDRSTPQLDILRSQLASLRHARANARRMSAGSALATAVLWSLAGVFALDWLFQREMQAPQRALLLLIAAGIVVWAYRKFAHRLLMVEETEVDMALMVERQQQIDSDLVAALQFEDDVQGRWGSRQLETAVIDYVAHLGPDIDVFQGFNRDQLRKRATLFGITAGLALVAGLLFPGHLAAFMNRIALGSAHYPSRTQIESLAINGRDVLSRGMQPENIRCAEGREVQFLVRSSGVLPEAGIARLAAQAGGQRTEIELKPLTGEERLARLRSAQAMVDEARKSPDRDLTGPWFEELASLVQFEAPQQWKQLGLDAAQLSGSELAKELPQKLPEIEQMLAELTTAGAPADGDSPALYLGRVPRLNDAVRYRITLGDAYTDPAEIEMIALPAVAAKLTPIPPKYAAKVLANEPSSGRQTAVLIGSQVTVALECTNEKPLRDAWILVRTSAATQSERYDLEPVNDARTQWALATKSPFSRVEEELRYEIQVTDDDGLHLGTPIKGSVRMRADKPPVAIASTVHRVVLPTAKPTVQYRVGDDFGIKRLDLVVQVERQVDQQQQLSASAETNSSPTATTESTQAPAAAAGGEEVELETTTLNLLTARNPVSMERLPLAGKAAVSLASLKLDPSRGSLQKGDRLKVVLVVEDDRGSAAGEVFRSEPLVIEVSDEFGVASAVGEADPQAEQRVTEIIKRQLGIGESP